MLKTCFGGGHEIKHTDLRSTDLSQFDLFVLPGSFGEVSPYPDLIGESEASLLLDAVEKNGLILWTDCSATYYMHDRIEYTTSAGLHKTRPGLGLIDGVARGPVTGKALAPTEDSRFSDVVIRRIGFNYGTTRCTADICYGNGPKLELSASERANPDVKILARYCDAPDAPIAGITKKIGTGLLISLGVLVQISPEDMIGHFQDETSERHRLALFNHLSAADSGRRLFLDMIVQQIREHEQARKTRGLHKDFGGLHVTSP